MAAADRDRAPASPRTLASAERVGHGDVEMLHARADVGDDSGHLGAAVGPGAIVDENPHRAVDIYGCGSDRPAMRSSAPKAVLKKPSVISASVKALRSVARRLLIS